MSTVAPVAPLNATLITLGRFFMPNERHPFMQAWNAPAWKQIVRDGMVLPGDIFPEEGVTLGLLQFFEPHSGRKARQWAGRNREWIPADASHLFCFFAACPGEYRNYPVFAAGGNLKRREDDKVVTYDMCQTHWSGEELYFGWGPNVEVEMNGSGAFYLMVHV